MVWIYIPNAEFKSLQIPEKVKYIILPAGSSIQLTSDIPILYQVNSIEEARQAEKSGAKGIIIKGNEAGGLVGYESTFVLFQRVIKEIQR